MSDTRGGGGVVLILPPRSSTMESSSNRINRTRPQQISSPSQSQKTRQHAIKISIPYLVSLYPQPALPPIPRLSYVPPSPPGRSRSSSRSGSSNETRIGFGDGLASSRRMGNRKGGNDIPFILTTTTTTTATTSTNDEEKCESITGTSTATGKSQHANLPSPRRGNEPIFSNDRYKSYRKKTDDKGSSFKSGAHSNTSTKVHIVEASSSSSATSPRDWSSISSRPSSTVVTYHDSTEQSSRPSPSNKTGLKNGVSTTTRQFTSSPSPSPSPSSSSSPTTSSAELAFKSTCTSTSIPTPSLSPSPPPRQAIFDSPPSFALSPYSPFSVEHLSPFSEKVSDNEIEGADGVHVFDYDVNDEDEDDVDDADDEPIKGRPGYESLIILLESTSQVDVPLSKLDLKLVQQDQWSRLDSNIASSMSKRVSGKTKENFQSSPSPSTASSSFRPIYHKLDSSTSTSQHPLLITSPNSTSHVYICHIPPIRPRSSKSTIRLPSENGSTPPTRDQVKNKKRKQNENKNSVEIPVGPEPLVKGPLNTDNLPITLSVALLPVSCFATQTTTTPSPPTLTPSSSRSTKHRPPRNTPISPLAPISLSSMNRLDASANLGLNTMTTGVPRSSSPSGRLYRENRNTKITCSDTSSGNGDRSVPQSTVGRETELRIQVLEWCMVKNGKLCGVRGRSSGVGPTTSSGDLTAEVV